jgi:hypothetical protein
MSISLGYRPVKNDLKCFASSNNLHSILSDEFGVPCTIGETEIGFLRGLVAAGYKDCQDLIEAICEHGKIEIKKMDY